MNKIEINMKTFPKHKIKLFNDNELRDVVEVDCGISAFNELIDCGNPFEDIRMKRMCKRISELFEVQAITIIGKQ